MNTPDIKLKNLDFLTHINITKKDENVKVTPKMPSSKIHTNSWTNGSYIQRKHKKCKPCEKNKNSLK